MSVGRRLGNKSDAQTKHLGESMFKSDIFHAQLLENILLRDDFREGDEDSNFQFSESGGSLNGPDLFTEVPFL